MTKMNMYFSVDIETDGDAPGVSSMLSIGIVALVTKPLSVYRTFYRTLRRLPDARPLTATMEWWDQYPESWAAARKETIDPKVAMEDMRRFVQECLAAVKSTEDGEVTLVPIFVAKPAGFDFSWVYYYCHRFLGECPFGFAPLDMGSLAMGLTGKEAALRSSSWPKEWTEGLQKNDHHALRDAENQAEIFCRMMLHRKDRGGEE